MYGCKATVRIINQIKHKEEYPRNIICEDDGTHYLFYSLNHSRRGYFHEPEKKSNPHKSYIDLWNAVLPMDIYLSKLFSKLHIFEGELPHNTIDLIIDLCFIKDYLVHCEKNGYDSYDY